jgi:hypothetical protein
MPEATVISLINFVKSLPRFVSSAPFFRLIVAHLEWPLIARFSVGKQVRVRSPA